MSAQEGPAIAAATDMAWDYPHPHLVEVEAASGDIDIMGHTNNVVYLRWLEKAAWAHTKALGVDWDVYRRLNRAMVARRHEMDYLAACYAGDRILIGTWLKEPGRLGMRRLYQLIRVQDGRTVMRAATDWVCIRIDSGRPSRMPPEFVAAYQATC